MISISIKSLPLTEHMVSQEIIEGIFSILVFWFAWHTITRNLQKAVSHLLGLSHNFLFELKKIYFAVFKRLMR